MRRKLTALPPYEGSKRRLLNKVFRHLPGPVAAPVFVDAFLGGGRESLFAKARGCRVAWNDTAFQSYVVAKGFIENDRVTLGTEDVTQLLQPNGDTSNFVGRP
jgi:adenine-specific DNA methylase